MVWFALAIIAIVIELFSGTFYLLVLALSFAITGTVAWLGYDNLSVNVTLCSLLSIVGIIAVTLFHRRHHPHHTTAAKLSPDLDVGQTVVLINTNDQGRWEVSYRGAQWQAEWLDNTTPTAGQTAIIVGKRANLLLLRQSQ